MSNRNAIAPACPPWCVCAHPSEPGCWPVEIHHTHPAGDNILVHLERHDEDGEVGDQVVVVAAVDPVDGGLGGLHPDYPLTVDEAEALARHLLAAVAAARGGSK